MKTQSLINSTELRKTTYCKLAGHRYARSVVTWSACFRCLKTN